MTLTSKPESILCSSIHIIAITCQLLFEFSIRVLNFVRIHFCGSIIILRFCYKSEKREIKDLQNQVPIRCKR